MSYSTGRTSPFTGAEYLESLRDDREIWIYGERVKDVTTHPAFRNTARMIARLYDALHDPARQAVLTTETDTGSGGYTHAFFRAPRNAEEHGRRRAMRSPSGRASPTAGWAAAPTTRRPFSRRSARTRSFYEPYDENARRWYTRVQEEVSFVNHAIVNPPVDRDKPLDEVERRLHARREARPTPA